MAKWEQKREVDQTAERLDLVMQSLLLGRYRNIGSPVGQMMMMMIRRRRRRGCRVTVSAKLNSRARRKGEWHHVVIIYRGRGSQGERETQAKGDGLLLYSEWIVYSFARGV